jgi:hypothetical protein
VQIKFDSCLQPSRFIIYSRPNIRFYKEYNFKKIVLLSEPLKSSDYVLSNDKWKSGRGLILNAALHVSAGID